MSSDIEFVLESAVHGFHVYRVAPWTVAEVTELVRQAVEQRTTRLTIESFRSRPPAPQRHRRSRYKSRLQPSPLHLYTRVCVWSCAHGLARTYTYTYTYVLNNS